MHKQIKRVIFILLILLFSASFLFSGYHVVEYVYEGSVQKSLQQELIREAVSAAPKEPEKVKVPIRAEEGKAAAEKEISLLLTPDISVDLAHLKQTLPDVVGWLYSEDQRFHAPILQSSDNAYYVTRLPDGTENRAGSLFLDYRCPSDLSGWSQVLYGHNMNNGTMFGPLMDYRSAPYFWEHPYLFYFTENGVYRAEIFAAIHTKADSLIYSLPQSEEEISAYLSHVYQKSVFSSGISVSAEDRILVLTTCSTGTASLDRFAVFAKLVPIEENGAA